MGWVSSRAGPRIAGYDREIELWLGARIEGNRKLDPDSPRWPECPLKSAECDSWLPHDGFPEARGRQVAPEKLKVLVG